MVQWRSPPNVFFASMWISHQFVVLLSPCILAIPLSLSSSFSLDSYLTISTILCPYPNPPCPVLLLFPFERIFMLGPIKMFVPFNAYRGCGCFWGYIHPVSQIHTAIISWPWALIPLLIWLISSTLLPYWDDCPTPHNDYFRPLHTWDLWVPIRFSLPS